MCDVDLSFLRAPPQEPIAPWFIKFVNHETLSHLTAVGSEFDPLGLRAACIVFFLTPVPICESLGIFTNVLVIDISEYTTKFEAVLDERAKG